jgi:hypothetical protein
VNKNDYKRAFMKVEPDQDFQERLVRNVLKKTSSKGQRWRTITSLGVACLFLIVGAGVFLQWNEERSFDQSQESPIERRVTEGAVYIPQVEIPEQQSGKAMDMIGLIVYQGRVYLQSDTTVTAEAAKPLLGEKIGRTKGNLNEWNSQKDYEQEMASSIGVADVYKVKGYDHEFRVMTYEEINGEIYAQFYDCLNGLEVRTGEDVFKKFGLAGNVQSVRWERFDSWNNSLGEYEDVPVDAKFESFLQSLNAAKPIEQDVLMEQGIYENEEQKFILIKLKDQTEVRLRLFKDGYVKYGFVPVFFKVEDAAFTEMWEDLE